MLVPLYPGALLGRSCEHGFAIPTTQQQRDFDVEAVGVDRSAATFDRSLHAILDGIEVKMEFLGGGFEA